MLVKTVKISNVTNLSDARYCAGMGVEMLGFSIDEDSPNYISPKKFEDICSWLAGVTLVAETSLTDAQHIMAALQNYPVHALQIDDPGLLSYLHSELGLPMILRIKADYYEADEINAILSRYEQQVAHFLIESDEEKTLSEDWMAAFEKLSPEYPILVGFGLENDQVVGELVQQLPQVGIALKGSEEIRPGFKDFGALMDILEALED